MGKAVTADAIDALRGHSLQGFPLPCVLKLELVVLFLISYTFPMACYKNVRIHWLLFTNLAIRLCFGGAVLHCLVCPHNFEFQAPGGLSPRHFCRQAGLWPRLRKETGTFFNQKKNANAR